MTLSKWIKEKNLEQQQVAAQLGISPSYMSEISLGRKTPGAQLTRKIEILTDGAVTLADWFPALAPTETPEAAEEQVHG